MHSHIDELTATDNVSAGAVGIEFVMMMNSIDGLANAALMLGYVEAMGRLGALVSDTIIADAVTRIAAEPELDQARTAGRALDAHHALDTMHDVLDELTAGGHPKSRLNGSKGQPAAFVV